MKKVLHWIAFIFLAIWQLPQFLVSVIMLPFLGKLSLVADRHFNYCWVGERMNGGISLGPFCFISKNLNKSYKREEYIAHEVDGHTVDSKIFGPLYLIIVGIPSILNAMFDFTKCYYDFYKTSCENNASSLDSSYESTI